VADMNPNLSMIDAEENFGFWTIDVTWKTDGTTTAPVHAVVRKFTHVVEILSGYGSYESATIQFTPFTNPKDA